MRKVITVILLGVIMSFFFYPIDFTFLPGLNTKKIISTFGLLVFGVKIILNKESIIRKDIVVDVAYAFVFSFICYYAAARMDTGDDTYSTYYSSFFVWLFAGYGVCNLFRWAYGVVDLKTITFYLGAVAVAQCLLSQLIDSNQAVMDFVDRFVVQNQDNLHDMNRLYGIGVSLDSGGVRFAVTLVMISHFIVLDTNKGGHGWEIALLFSEFIVITVYGNMIARTTIVGSLLGLGYILFDAIRHGGLSIRKNALKSAGIILVLLGLAIILFISLFKSDSEMNRSLKFAFEGFFNWVETGTFYTDSTDKLNATMWKWPEDRTSWIIGTGKFGNWAFGTDIGYCRFILYCGLVGMVVFSLFFIHNAISFYKMYDDVGMLALLLLATTFIIWLKVSTDIFQIYALVLCADGIVEYIPEEKKE